MIDVTLIVAPFAGRTPREVRENGERAAALGDLLDREGRVPVLFHPQGVALFGHETEPGVRDRALSWSQRLTRQATVAGASVFALERPDGTLSDGCAAEVEIATLAGATVERSTWMHMLPRFEAAGMLGTWAGLAPFSRTADLPACGDRFLMREAGGRGAAVLAAVVTGDASEGRAIRVMFSRPITGGAAGRGGYLTLAEAHEAAARSDGAGGAGFRPISASGWPMIDLVPLGRADLP